MKKLNFFIAILFIALAGNMNAQTEYEILVGGTRVTSENCNNITGSDIEGKISFDPDTKTLTLDNATIHGNLDMSENVTINLIGENIVDDYINQTDNDLTISGSGKLSAKSMGYSNGNILIKDCSIELINDEWGLYGYGYEVLTINNANVLVDCNAYAIGDFSEINLINCSIIEPANNKIDIDPDSGGEIEDSKFIVNEDGSVAKKVVIKSNAPTNINSVVEQKTISIYPNPTTNEIVISNIANNELVEIFDITGKLAKKAVYHNKIDVSDLLAGVYTIKVNNRTQKLVIE